MRIEKMTITPSIAADFLSKNTKNRPLSERRVCAIANAINNGEWRLNGDAIRFSAAGELIDGQTRLSAIIRSGIPVESIVVFGLPDDAFGTIDINGSARTASDVLAIKGIKYYKLCAMVAQCVLIWEASGVTFVGNISKSRMITTTEIADRASSDLLLQNIVEEYAKLKRLSLISARIYCYVRYSTMRFDREKSDLFFSQLTTGANLEDGSPVLLLREMLMRMRSARSSERASIIVAYVFLAFEFFCLGRKCKQLKIWMDGAPRNIHRYQGINYMDKTEFNV
jgi:hypothetical protein